MPTNQIINDVLPKTQSTATNLQVNFDADWTASETTDVVVYARAAGVDADDATQLISSNDYTVTFIGTYDTVRVTFLVGRTTGDIVTLTRSTPASRENLYTNTALTPSMLNQDNAILTLVDQQSELYDTRLNPHYNRSSTLTNPSTPAIDTILPILDAGQTWVKNAGNTAIVGFDLPVNGGGVAPKNAKYLLQVADADLPNAQAMGSLASGVVVNTATTGVQLTRTLTGTANEIGVVDGTGISGNPTFGIVDNPTIPGTEYILLPSGTTAQRPGIPTDGMVRYNTTTQSLEVYEGSTWDALAGGIVDSIFGTSNQIDVDNTDPQNPILSLPVDVQISNSILDANAATILDIDGIASAVNYIRITNNATGSPVQLSAQGTDTNIPFNIESKGTSEIRLVGGNTTNGIRIYNGTLSGGNPQHNTMFSFANTLASRVVTWPDSDGTVAFVSDLNGYVQSTTGTANQIDVNNTDPQNPIFALSSNPVVPGTAGMTVPKGTVAQRAGAAGTLRFNTDASVLEATLDGATWLTLDTHTAGDVDSIIGTANQIIASNPTGNVTLSLPQSIATTSSPAFAALTLTNPHIVGAGGIVSFQIFTTGTAATYTKPAGIKSILVEVLGGGGGGGACLGQPTGTSAGGGGGSGGYARLWVPTSAATYTYTVGAAGAGGVAGLNNGSNGGTTTFSASSLQATGGAGGEGSNSVVVGSAEVYAGGLAGIGTGGNFNCSGEVGRNGMITAASLLSGGGGSSIYGGGARPLVRTIGTGINAGNYGSGGSGAGATTVNAAGGNGSAGLIIVWEMS